MRFIRFVIIVILAIICYGYYQVSFTTVGKQDFSVQKGDTIISLRTKLGIDIHPLLYKIAVKFYYSNGVLQSGSYHMAQNVSLRTFLVETIREPQSKDISIRILPGWNIFDIDASLTQDGRIQSGEIIGIAEHIPSDLRQKYPFLTNAPSLEGFLLPDTYRIKPSSTSKEIVDILLAEFWKQIYSAHPTVSSEDFYRNLILASIVEKEEKVTENKPIVAGILRKRYEEGELIGADATVCYAYRLTMTGCTPDFINAHVHKKTPYNTREMTGLPPTPIANPSAETFAATINSESSPYYYYLHDTSGIIHYGRTLEEHNSNRVRYLGK